jgi:membrane protein required for colicin V production
MLMLAVLAAATLFGLYKGVVWQLASLASILVSYVAAMRLRGPVAAMIKAEEPWNMFLAMLILYVATSVAIWLAFRVVSTTIDKLKLKTFDRQLGGFLGAVKGVALCVVITLFAVTLLDDLKKRSIIESHSGYYIAHLLDRSHAVMPTEVHDVLHPFLHGFDERLETLHPEHLKVHERSQRAAF